MKSDAYTRAAEPRPATEQAPGLTRNHAGGYVHQIDALARARRFLILGTEGGTFYQREGAITRENARSIEHLAHADPAALVDLIADVSSRGIAPKVQPALFALAICTATPGDARALALRSETFQRIVRTGSHLLTWARYHKALGGGVGRSWRRAVSEWYLSRDADALAYQIAKYRQRDGWAQRDLVRLSHAKPEDAPRRAVFDWMLGRETDPEALPTLLATLNDTSGIIADRAIHAGASWEMLPDAVLRDANTWRRLLDKGLPATALMRNLARMTSLGVFDDFGVGKEVEAVRSLFGSMDALRRARLHPLSILMAQRQYAQGATRSGLSYRPHPAILATLEDGFYRAFHTAPASGKRHLVALDVSGSMTFGNVTGFPITPAEIGAALVMKIMASEPASHVVGFADTIRPLPFHGRMSLDEALSVTRRMSFGYTAPSLAIEYARERGMPVDTFVVITDNEVNAGHGVPETLRRYRRETGIDARLAVLATTATSCTIADPADPGMIDIVGFGSDVPALLTSFSAGDLG